MSSVPGSRPTTNNPCNQSIMIKLTQIECPREPNQFTLHTDKNWFGRVILNGEMTAEQQREHMRHMVAAWNACLGLNVSCLEENGAAGMSDMVAMAREIAGLRARVRELENVGINGLTAAETSASMSVAGLSKPPAQSIISRDADADHGKQLSVYGDPRPTNDTQRIVEACAPVVGRHGPGQYELTLILTKASSGIKARNIILKKTQ